MEVEGRCAQTTLYIEVFNHTLPLTQRFRRRRHVGYWWKRTQELTRSLRAAYAPELTKITWSFSCLTWRFDCSAVVFGLCVFSNSSLDCVCMCGVGLFLSPSTSERGCSCIYHVFLQSLRMAYAKGFLTKSLRNLTRVQVLLTHNFDMTTH